jgi:hypothetical protein
MTVLEMITDLAYLVDKGYGDKQIEIYHKDLDEYYKYNGACGGETCIITIED